MQEPYLIEFDIKGDDRGSLIALEELKEIPFKIKRVYYIFDTKKGVIRGNHAHKSLRQVLICVKGSVKVKCEYENSIKEFCLDNPNIGLYIEDLTWRTMYDFSEDAVLVVLADSLYSEQDYIRDYSLFKKQILS